MVDVQYPINLTNDNLAAAAKLRANVETIKLSYTPDEIERMKLCGILFDRRSSFKKDLIDEFFRKEPCTYDQFTYKYAARIFHCLKVDLNENPILKTIRQQQQLPNQDEEQRIADVPKINYKNNQEKKNTLKLAFSVLRFQKLLEQLFDECQFYAKYPDSKDDQSLACTILFDYMMRKFQQREITEDELTQRDALVALLEQHIYQEKTHLAAALARNRIKQDALTVEELLPMELREVEQHKAELPLYCWVNPLKAQLHEIIDQLKADEGLTMVDSKLALDHRCFMVDPHCPNVLMFHYTLRNKIMNHEFVKDFKLIVQDKSSCLAPYTVQKLLYKKDDVILTNIGGGLIAAYLGCMMQELEGRVYVYGATTDEKYEEITQKLTQIGCLKYVKIMREDFLNVKFDESKLDNVKVILINAPCTKSALMNPMEFLFQEGEDIRLLRDFSVDLHNDNRIKKAIQNETALVKHALRFPHVRAIVYQTYSKNMTENDQLISKLLQEFNDTRRSTVFPYKLAPPVIPITMSDIQSDEIAKGVKYLQFKPSNRMNGCFVALLTRDKDAKIDKEARKAEALIEKKARQAAIAAAAAEEAEEAKAKLEAHTTDSTENTKKKPTLRKQSAPIANKKKLLQRKSLVNITPKTTMATIDEQILQLQNRELAKTQEPVKQPMIYTTSTINSLEAQLAKIGKLSKTEPERSSTPNEQEPFTLPPFNSQQLQMREFQFQLKNKTIDSFLNSIKNDKPRKTIINSKFKIPFYPSKKVNKTTLRRKTLEIRNFHYKTAYRLKTPKDSDGNKESMKNVFLKKVQQPSNINRNKSRKGLNRNKSGKKSVDAKLINFVRNESIKNNRNSSIENLTSIIATTTQVEMIKNKELKLKNDDYCNKSNLNNNKSTKHVNFEPKYNDNTIITRTVTQANQSLLFENEISCEVYHDNIINKYSKIEDNNKLKNNKNTNQSNDDILLLLSSNQNNTDSARLNNCNSSFIKEDKIWVPPNSIPVESNLSVIAEECDNVKSAPSNSDFGYQSPVDMLKSGIFNNEFQSASDNLHLVKQKSEPNLTSSWPTQTKKKNIPTKSQRDSIWEYTMNLKYIEKFLQNRKQSSIREFYPIREVKIEFMQPDRKYIQQKRNANFKNEYFELIGKSYTFGTKPVLNKNYFKSKNNDFAFKNTDYFKKNTLAF